MPVGRLLSFSWSQKALWSRKEIHPAPLRFTVLSTWGVFQAGHENLALVFCWVFLLETFQWGCFFLKDCYDSPILMRFTRVNPALGTSWILVSPAPRGNNSAVRSGLRPTVIPAAEVGGWWLVAGGWWLVAGGWPSQGSSSPTASAERWKAAC